MDPVALFTSTQGRIASKPFWLALLAVYLASLASQFLLTGAVVARSGVWPFVVVQAGILWAWTVVHIKRLRDAGRPPGGAVGVAALYGLSAGLLLLLIAIVMDPGQPSAPGQEPPAQAMFGFFLFLAILAILFSPDLGIFSLILKALLVIAFLPVIISLTFSLYTGLRRSVP